jgi:PAP2 superfamily protein
VDEPAQNPPTPPSEDASPASQGTSRAEPAGTPLEFAESPERLRLVRFNLAVIGLLALAVVVLFGWHGIRLGSRDLALPLFLEGSMIALYLVYSRWRHGPQIRDAMLGTASLILALQLAGLATYGLAPFAPPLVDEHLARADASLGWHAPAVVGWARAHPPAVSVIGQFYNLFGVQLLVFPVLLGLFLRDLRALWEYVVMIELTALCSVVIFGLFPAFDTPHYYGFEPFPVNALFVQELTALRAGTLETLELNEMRGLIELPSFHTITAILNVWVFRRRRVALALALVGNLGMYFGTLVVGAHFFVDGLAALAVCALCWWVYRRWLAPSPPGPSPAPKSSPTDTSEVPA